MSISLRIPSPAAASPANVAGLWQPLVGLVATLCRHAERARTRRVVAALSAEQLADVAIDRATVVPDRPVIEVERGLMDRLLNLR